MNPFPFSGTCECGWPVFSDGMCSNGECPLGWTHPDDIEDDETEDMEDE